MKVLLEIFNISHFLIKSYGFKSWFIVCKKQDVDNSKNLWKSFPCDPTSSLYIYCRTKSLGAIILDKNQLINF